MGSRMRLGLAQMDMVHRDKAGNLAACRQMIGQAAEEKVDLLLFPELTLTGFSSHIAEDGEALDSSQTLDFFSREAAAHHMAMGFGMIVSPSAQAEKGENHCVLLGREGQLLADYAKIHPFSFGAEGRFYTGGTDWASCQLDDFTIAPFVCYDLRFPEIFRVHCRQVQLMTVIANWPSTRMEHWYLLLRARALENQCYVAGVNRWGQEGKLSYIGGSTVVAPDGTILVQDESGPGLVTCDIERETVDKTRKALPFLPDRRPEIYAHLFAREAEEQA